MINELGMVRADTKGGGSQVPDFTPPVPFQG